jgi:FliI/YscN family ATPase
MTAAALDRSLLIEAVRSARPWAATGSIARVVGHEIEIRGIRVRVGDTVTLEAGDADRTGEVVGVSAHGATVLVYGETAGLGKGDRVSLRHGGLTIPVSDGLIGRVIDGTGRPLDGRPLPAGAPLRIDDASTIPTPMTRRRIAQALPVGVRAIDSLCTVGRGQRVGIFGGSGVGKSTLLGMIARGTAADITVLALIGERGREVREFIEDDLGPGALERCVVVVATSDQPPLIRLRASFLAARLAEYYADEGRDVMLMFDSLTRLAMAQRDVGLAAGEPPTARGYTPSVFSLMPKLLERAGPRKKGTVTAFYTVLVEGDDMNDPIADAARSILDGHIVLSRRLAVANRFPAIDPLASLSRLAPRVTTEDQTAWAGSLRNALAAAEEVRDMVEVGAYVPGSNPVADKGLAAEPDIVSFLKQDMHDVSDFEQTWSALGELAGRVS